VPDNYYDPVRGFQFGEYTGPRPPQPNLPFRTPDMMVGPAPPVTADQSQDVLFYPGRNVVEPPPPPPAVASARPKKRKRRALP
jgi:hypothetical protein